MWVCLNNSFLSIVHKNCAPDELLVRARVKGHIEAVFSGAKVISEDGSDYQFRAVLQRTVVAAVLVDQVATLNYDNFKNSVSNTKLHDAFARIWHVMAALQPKRPYSNYSGRGRQQGALL